MEAPTQTKSQTKFDDARALRDSLRFNELRQKRGTDRSAEENREYARLYRRNKYKADREGLKATQISKQVLANTKDVDSFWAHNRSMTDGKAIHRYLEMQERYLDEMFWLNHGWQVPPDNEDFVGLDEGIACMEDFIAERGMIHDENFTSPFLQSWKPFWGIWQDKKDYTDAIWGRVSPFWLDQERFHELCKESEATKIYARYGIRLADKRMFQPFNRWSTCLCWRGNSILFAVYVHNGDSIQRLIVAHRTQHRPYDLNSYTHDIFSVPATILHGAVPVVHLRSEPRARLVPSRRARRI